MVLSETDNRVIAAIQGGLPLSPRPWAEIAERLEMDEAEVIRRVRRLQESGYIKRMGIVVRHHELGYHANAMVVWDVPDDQVDQVGDALGRQRCVTLCYRRPRRPPHWPYNLFCMIHGKDRQRVLDYLDLITEELGLREMPREVLFSGRRFKQRGARYR